MSWYSFIHYGFTVRPIVFGGNCGYQDKLHDSFSVYETKILCKSENVCVFLCLNVAVSYKQTLVLFQTEFKVAILMQLDADFQNGLFWPNSHAS